MKNQKRFGGILLLASILFISACELDSDCKTCRIVTYEKINGAWEKTDEDTAEEYCGEDLDNIEAQDPVIIGDTKTQWECSLF